MFRRKVQAGANAGITQFFFNPDAYFYFIERLAKSGINIPIAPGIMPITNASNLIRFADGTGAEIHVGFASNLQLMVMIAQALKHLVTKSSLTL